MADEPFYSPKAKPPPPRAPRPGETLFEFRCGPDHKVFRVELRDHGQWGVEAQIFQGDDLLIAQLLQEVYDGERVIPARELAIAWARQAEKAMGSRAL